MDAKTPCGKPQGEHKHSPDRGMAAKTQPTLRPTEYRCFIKEGKSVMAQRVR